MSRIDLDNLNQEFYDVLREIGNIGAGNATTALAQMLGCKVDMAVPQVRLLEFSEVGTIMGGEEQIMAGIYLMVEGDITGSILFLLNKESARKLIAKLMGMEMAIIMVGFQSFKKIIKIIIARPNPKIILLKMESITISI